MYLHEERIISGDLAEVWRIDTDVAHWPEWNPHEEFGEIYGEFSAGTRACSKPRGGPRAQWILTEVTKERSWSLVNKMPIGSLEVENRYERLPGNQVKCAKTMLVKGVVLRLLFKLHFEKETRKDMHATWLALEKRAGDGHA